MGNGKYRIAEVVGFQEISEEYVIEKLRTNLRIGVKYTNKVEYMRMILISNSSPNQDEFTRMLRNRDHFKLPKITQETVQTKLQDIKRIEDLSHN